MEQVLKRLELIDERILRISDIISRNKTVLTIDEAAQYCGLSKRYLYKLTSGRQIPYYKQKRKVYFKKDELDEWLLKDRIQTEEELESQAIVFRDRKPY